MALIEGVVLIVIVCVCFGSCRSIPNSDEAMAYLKKYHYAGKEVPDSSLSSLMDTDQEMAMKMGLMMYQMKWNLTMTGNVTDETLEWMRKPRCGMPDLNNMEDIPPMSDSKKRKKRFVLQGSKWPRNILSYKIQQYPDQSGGKTTLARGVVFSEIRRAFDVWQNVTPLTFTHITDGIPDIAIEFSAGLHSDRFPFDGPGKELAHAFFPSYGGDAHFDNDETFTSGSATGTNLFQVAAHEFGHSLGLSHSEDKDALMYPFYRGYQPDFMLHPDDVMGIQAVYGVTARPTMAPGVTLNAITTHTDGVNLRTYAFVGDNCLELDSAGFVFANPMSISAVWPDLSGPLDAALAVPPVYGWAKGKSRYNSTVIQPEATYFFKGDRCWKYENRTPVSGFPKSISMEFPGIPSGLDAAFIWSGNGRIYFIKGSQYYRCSKPTGRTPEKKCSKDNGYPRNLSNWEGLPGKIDAAYQSRDKMTYFFSSRQVYLFDDQKFKVANGYPQPIDDILRPECVGRNIGPDDVLASSAVTMGLSTSDALVYLSLIGVIVIHLSPVWNQ